MQWEFWCLVNSHVHVGGVCWHKKGYRASRMEALSWSLLNGFQREDYRLAVHPEHFHQRECTISAPSCTPSIHRMTDGADCNAHVQITDNRAAWNDSQNHRSFFLHLHSCFFTVFFLNYTLLLFNRGEVSVCFSQQWMIFWSSLW